MNENRTGTATSGSRQVGRVAIALFAGLIVGIGVASAGSPVLSRAVGWLEPIGQIWVNAIRMTVVPLVFALLLGAVARSGESEGVGRLGGVAFAAFVALHVFVGIVTLSIVPPLMNSLPIDPASVVRLQADAASASTATDEQLRALPGLAQWVAGLAPANPIRAAADGAMLPLLVFAVLFALALRRITPDRRDHVLRVFDGVAAAMLQIVRWLIALAPIGVFTLVAPTAARLGLSLAGALGYYVVTYIAVMIMLIIAFCIVGALGGGVPIPRFVRALLPAQAVAFSSSSSLASLPALIDSAARLGIRQPVAGFVLPLAVASFKAAGAAVWLIGTLFLARLFGVPLGVADYFTIVVAAIAISFATPGVPNGGLLTLAPFFPGFGIPAAGIALLIAVDAIPDLFATVTNVSADFAAAAITDRHAARGVAVDVPAPS